jgi:nucleoside-diphosphate-sugar epimerase
MQSATSGYYREFGDIGEATVILVVTGATGFVGRALVRHCIENVSSGPTDMELRVLVRSTGRLPMHPKIREYEGDLNLENSELFPDQPHVLVHLANKNVDHDGSGFQQTNVHGTEKLLRACRPSTRGMIYNSSLSVLGQGAQVNCSHMAPVLPQTDLALSRAQAEEIVWRRGRELDITAYCLRPRFILGEGDNYVMPALAKLVNKGIYLGSGEQRYSVIDVDDYAKIIIQLATRCVKTDVVEQIPLNIGYSSPLSYEAIYSELRKNMASASGKKTIPAPALLASLLKRIPNKTLQAKAIQLQLIGLDHFADTAATQSRLNHDVLNRDSLEYMKSLAQQYGGMV